MHEIVERIDLFVSLKMIDEIDREILLEWLKILNEQGYTKDLNKIEMLMTHCACMMKRTHENSQIDELPEHVLNQVKDNPYYEQCSLLLDSFASLYPIEEKERGYILMHLCSCKGVS